MDPAKTDPVIVDLLKWLKENLPQDVDDEAIFKKVRRVQKVFDTLIGLSFEEFYNHAISVSQQQQQQLHQQQQPPQHHHHEQHDEDDEEDDDDNEPKGDNGDDCQQQSSGNVTTLEQIVNEKINNIRDYINLNEEKQMKTKKLNVSRSKLDLKKEQYKLITSIRLEGCMDLISRYNRLMSKK